jgi:alpha-L-fucosidase
LQPNAVIFGSLGATPYVDVRWVGNEKGIAGKPCWATIDPISLEKETMSELNSGKEDGVRFIPAEADVSVRPGWFYHSAQDDCVRTPANLFNLWASSLGRNAGWLLNFPPDRRGLIHEKDIESYEKFLAELAEDIKTDFAKSAKITASSVRSPEFVPENLTNGEYESFYAPEDGCFTPEITLEFESECEINGVVFGEMIELGHHIRGYEIQAFADGEWKIVGLNI